MVAHTKISKLLAILYVNSWCSFDVEEDWLAATRVSAQSITHKLTGLFPVDVGCGPEIAII